MKHLRKYNESAEEFQLIDLVEFEVFVNYFYSYIITYILILLYMIFKIKN